MKRSLLKLQIKGLYQGFQWIVSSSYLISLVTQVGKEKYQYSESNRFNQAYNLAPSENIQIIDKSSFITPAK